MAFGDGFHTVLSAAQADAPWATFSGDEDRFRSWVFSIAHRRLTDDRRAPGCRCRREQRPRARAAGGRAPLRNDENWKEE